jgi:hypothetical protein
MSMLNLSLDMEKVLTPPATDVGEGSGELDIGPEERIDRWAHRCLAVRINIMLVETMYCGGEGLVSILHRRVREL